MGTFGSRLSDKQARLLASGGSGTLYIAYDMDAAGAKGWRSAKKLLESYGVTVKRVRWDGWKDVAEIPVEQRAEIFSEIVV